MISVGSPVEGLISLNAHKSLTRSQGVLLMSFCVKKRRKFCSESMYLPQETPRLCSVKYVPSSGNPKVVFCDTKNDLIYSVSRFWGGRNFVDITALFVWLVYKDQYCGTWCFQVTWGETNNFLQHLLPSALLLLDTFILIYIGDNMVW